MRLSSDGLDASDAVPDVMVRAPASELMLGLWRRTPLTQRVVEGDPGVLAALLDAVRVT